ncbi:MAG: pyruvate carboxylase [Deltaproteobacteria bacterium]|nr:MAG: pyruvate carboxylase [Deltaproteobacteria bacterium]PIE75031.1 MAG: pyruvate carboxylase [Deltaproteobacteria bacterium]
MIEKNMQDFLDEIKGRPILIANRGITARRISRAISEIPGATSMITATDIDKSSPAAISAQKLMLLGKESSSYLDIDRIIRKAVEEGVAAIHPGWGFAAEDDSFPKKCRDAGIVFIGPEQEAMKILGNKVSVRKLAMELGIPVVPGSEEAVDIPEARKIACEIGFPVMLKAEGGGGGRGIYEVYSEEQLESAFQKASAMAEAAFGNPRIYVEKLLENVRHIEIQIAADKYGNVFAFDERDCTIQRNHQKLVEITPSPWPEMTEKLRTELKGFSMQLAKAVNYHTLCTVEFLVDQNGSPYLIEVNTRLQVEHGITECRYGIDLVEEQILLAFGVPLRLSEENTRPNQYAMQIRVNCEDPKDNFLPNAGRITRYISPGGQGIRVDSCITAGYKFPSQYDSAASLLIVYGNTWHKTVQSMRRALREYMISGVKTTIPFYRELLKMEAFNSGIFDTKFIEKHPEVFNYIDRQPESLRLAKLVAEISAKGYNEYVSLGEYRGVHDKRLGKLDVVLPDIPEQENYISPYPRGDRDKVLDFLRDTDYVHFTDTTPRDQTQSNSGNRFRLAEDRLIAPYLDRCNFFSIENGGGAHFHVAMLGNMTYPFTEAMEWNADKMSPNTMKQILIRSTNVLGYKPQSKNMMKATGEMICEHYDIVRCFDFLNHVDNMKPFAEVVLASKKNIFQPSISMSWAKGFDIERYLNVTKEIIDMTSKVAGVSEKDAAKMIILGLKDMAGVCPPRFIRELVKELRLRYPELVLHYHRHCTDGLFTPAVAAAAEAGAHIVDVAIGASVRWYGQGDVLATAAYMEGELGLETRLDKEMIRKANFVVKQIQPYYDKYCAPYFQGVDYDVVSHGMPGGATSSSQEGAMKQGYIHLLPYMLKYLEGIRQIVRYHDVTPGSQITWNTAFLAVTGAYKRGGEKNVVRLLNVLNEVVEKNENELSDEILKARLEIYRDSNDAFRDLIVGKFGRLPLGFPADWVYESAFGSENFKEAIASRTTASPLETLADIDLDRERAELEEAIQREATEEEFILYINHPGDALKTIRFQEKYGDPNNLPLDVWFEGVEKGESVQFLDSQGMYHKMTLLEITDPDDDGQSIVRFNLDSENLSWQVKVAEPVGGTGSDYESADLANPYHIPSPSTGDLWVMHVKPGDMVSKGEEVFNISIMKQEKAVFSKVAGRVKRVLKTADYQQDRKMVPVRDGELLVELEPVGESICIECKADIDEKFVFCPLCGKKQ